MRWAQPTGSAAASETRKMRAKKHHTAGLVMAALKWIFDLYPQASRGDRCAEHLFPLPEPGMARGCHLMATVTSKHGLASQAQASASVVQGTVSGRAFLWD